MTEDVTYENLAQGEVYEGHSGVEAYVAGAVEWSNDYRFVVVTSLSGPPLRHRMGDLGTNTGEAGGVPPTNKPYRIRGTSIGQLDETGKITLDRDYWNFADYLAQVGLTLTLSAPGRGRCQLPTRSRRAPWPPSPAAGPARPDR